MTLISRDDPGTWAPVDGSRFFYTVELPMSDDAQTMHGGPRPLFYGEFNTSTHGDEWQEYRNDPLAFLLDEGVPLPPVPADPCYHAHLGINILKLQEQPKGLEFVDPHEVYEREGVDAVRRRLHVSTMVLNHELPLNPQIGIT